MGNATRTVRKKAEGMSRLSLPLPEDEAKPKDEVSPLSQELVFGFVGYAGAGCSTAAGRLEILLEEGDYEVEIIKLSGLISSRFGRKDTLPVQHGIKAGAAKFKRACELQELGDNLRKPDQHYAVASLAIAEIIARRGDSPPGTRKLAFILDSLKHSAEVDLLRKVYDLSFRLIAVHCERPTRERRLLGSNRSAAKYAGVPEKDVLAYMDRDERTKVESTANRCETPSISLITSSTTTLPAKAVKT